MIIDALELADGSVVETDVCIIGAGPAGLTIAHELLKDDTFGLCVIESGGLSPEPETEALKALASVGGDLEPPVEALRRQYGGAANAWNVLTTRAGGGVRYLPLSPIDFEKRDWVPFSGWPFSKADLDPFYARTRPATSGRSITTSMTGPRPMRPNGPSMNMKSGPASSSSAIRALSLATA